MAYVVDTESTDEVAVVDIPNAILQQPVDAVAWIYVVDADVGATIKTINLPIQARQKPSDYVYTEDEWDDYSTLKYKKANGLEAIANDNPVAIYPDEGSLMRVRSSAETVIRCGKNMIPYPYLNTTGTKAGVTFTDNGDGSITINGTPTATAYFNLCDKIYFGNDYVTLQNATAKNGFAFSMRGDRYGNADVAVSGISLSYEGGTSRKVFIRVATGYTYENITVWPQVERGATATQWEPYCGGSFATSDARVNIPAISGVNTLYADTDGLLMVEYNKSLAKAMDECLSNATGGGIPDVDSAVKTNHISTEVWTEIDSRINTALGVVENGTY